MLYTQANAPKPSRFILNTIKASIERHTEPLTDSQVIQAMKDTGDYYDYRQDTQKKLTEATNALLKERFPRQND
jgi:hypothetical protein